MCTPSDLAIALPDIYSVVYILKGSPQCCCFYKEGKEGDEDRNYDILINTEYFAIIKKDRMCLTCTCQEKDPNDTLCLKRKTALDNTFVGFSVHLKFKISGGICPNAKNIYIYS